MSSEFDWQNDAPLRRPYDETIIYRLHVRGFTKHVSSKAKHKGTYLGIVDKIPYLKKLGITMIELMPAYEFNEMESHVATSMKGQFSIENLCLIIGDIQAVMLLHRKLHMLMPQSRVVKLKSSNTW